MTEQEIERCLERFATCKTTDVMNFDYAGTLSYIQRLKSENAALRKEVQYLIADGGADCCAKCIYGTEQADIVCERTHYGCLEGMTEWFKKNG